MLVVVAAGNDGYQGSGTIASLGYAKNAIVVGAHQNALEGFKAAIPRAAPALVQWLDSYRSSNGPSVLTSFSSRGPTADGRIKPDVVATVRAIVWVLALAVVDFVFSLSVSGRIHVDGRRHGLHADGQQGEQRSRLCARSR